ncbi:MAG: hypothetical protein ABR538_03945 [Candidatus Binatia bacterium]
MMDSLLAFLQTVAGRVAIVSLFTALLAVLGAPAWPAVGLALLLTTFLPGRRRELLAVATVAVLFVAPPVDLDLLAELGAGRGAGAWLGAWPLVVAAVLALACVFVTAIGRRPKSLPGRHPVLVLVALLTALFVVAAHAPLQGGPWFLATTSAMVLSSYVWFFAYAAAEAKLPGATPAWRQLGFWRPFWGFSNVPVGKGAAYLARVEARDAAGLARTQLSGLRLLAWAAVLLAAMDALRWFVYTPHPEGAAGGPFPVALLAWLPAEGLPRVADLLDAQARGEPFPLALRWASVIGEFVMSVLHMMTWGHPIVATCRMVGFAAAPNTDRPLLSTSIVEFYNRFYFYFKELLATFFFYPTYFRFFRGSPRLRVFAATAAAAGLGNFLFHFYRDSGEIFRLGFVQALAAYHVYACYALILGVAIGLSQLRLQARGRRPLRGPRRVLANAGVVAFYCLVGVLDARSPHSILEYAALYRSLVIP